MPGRPLVSVCTPTYNCAAYIAKLCDSLQAQTCSDFEVLFGNDGSTDNTQEVLAPYLKDPRFRVLTWKPNRGYGRATLALLSEARGEFWCHPGADDILHPDFIVARVELLRKNPGAVLAHGPPIPIDPAGNVIENAAPAWNVGEGFQWPSLPQLLQHNVINAPGIMARLDVTQKLLPHFAVDWRYAFDWYIWLLLAATGGNFIWDPVPRMRYRSHPGSLTAGPDALKRNQVETRLVPLVALATAAKLSASAAALWAKYRRPLYALWLMRALQISRKGMRCDDWIQSAARAFYGDERSNVTLGGEVARQAPWIIPSFLAEQLAVRRQFFRVAGLAQVNDPAFDIRS